MATRLVIFAAALALTGTYGCAPVATHPQRSSNSAVRAKKPAPAPLSSASAPRVITPPVPELTASTEPADESSLAPLAVSPEPLLSRPPSARREPADVPHNAGQPSEQRAPRTEPSPTSIDQHQRAQQPPERIEAGPKAAHAKAPANRSDTLLDQVERDLKRSAEMPVEPRPRLHFSKPVLENPRVRHFINYFSTKERETFAAALARSGKYLSMIADVLRGEGLPEEFAYLALIESYFSQDAVSPSGAVGLWQFMARTGRQYGLKIDAWIDERRDPIKSTRAAAAYLKDLHRYFDRWYLATAAYNAGQGAIERMIQSSAPKDFAALIEKSALSRETRNFVPKFVAAALVADNPEKYGFGNVLREVPAEFEEIEVQGKFSLAALAEMAGTDADTLRDLNPALFRGHTPPGDHRLRVPYGHLVPFELAYRQRKVEDSRVVTHEVKKGETLASIARRYRQQVRAVMELNGMTDSRIRIGQKLKVILEGLRGTLR